MPCSQVTFDGPFVFDFGQEMNKHVTYVNSALSDIFKSSIMVIVPESRFGQTCANQV
jgi:hypothetical protein